MEWEVEVTDECLAWWDSLSAAEQDSIDAIVTLLQEHGPQLPAPHSSQIKGAKHRHMRELRIQHAGEPYRILYAFDPRRVAILLLGGNKTGDDRWYDTFIPKADRIYDQYLVELKQKGLI